MQKLENLGFTLNKIKEEEVLLLRNHLKTGGRSQLKAHDKDDIGNNSNNGKNNLPSLPEDIIDKIFNMAEYWCEETIRIRGNKAETDFPSVALWNLFSIFYRFFTNLSENVGVSIDFMPTLNEGIEVHESLMNGTLLQGLPPLPQNVVDKIIDAADYWPDFDTIKSSPHISVQKYLLYYYRHDKPCLKKLAIKRIKGYPMRVSILYDAKIPLTESLYWLEISIYDKYEKNKLNEPLQLKLPNVNYKFMHNTSDSKIYAFVFEKNEYFMPNFLKGDTLVLSLRLAYPCWFKYFTYLQMSVFYIL